MRILGRRHHRTILSENEAGQAATVNGARYRDMITHSFCRNWMILIWPICGFNKTMPHAIQPMKQFNYCMRHFLGRVLSRFGDQNWPPRSCDLTLDFFLWGYLKSKIYVNNLTTTRMLQEEIKRWNLATIMQKDHEKFREKGVYVPTKPWRLFARCVIP